VYPHTAIPFSSILPKGNELSDLLEYEEESGTRDNNVQLF
jgi:hypothetical protein